MRARIAGGIVAALVPMAGTAGADPAPFDAAAILRELDRLDGVHKEQVAVEHRNVGDDLRKALLNPKILIDLYEEAVFSTRFDGAKKDSAEFRKWKTSQQATHKDDDFQAALLIHAHYLNLTLLRASGAAPVDLNEALVQHVRRVWSMEARFDLAKKQNAELLERPVTQGVIARRYGLGQKLGGPQADGKIPDRDKSWEWLSANTDGMLDKTVFPFLRDQRAPLAIALWDERINNEAARAKRTGLNDRIALFTQQTLSRLLWRRAGDLVLLDRRPEGCLAMLEILRQNLNHPDFERNVQELRKLLTGGAATQPAPAGN